jgi:hypothetical protein
MTPARNSLEKETRANTNRRLDEQLEIVADYHLIPPNIRGT